MLNRYDHIKNLGAPNILVFYLISKFNLLNIMNILNKNSD